MKIEENLVAEGTFKEITKKINEINEENLDGLRMHKIGEDKYQLYVKERKENDSYN